uniref:RING-type domain-containing protein n=1 Tax=Rhodosorus marinus TaxID=101924 RepID=A0A7S2ZAJ2_9RHOD|mmetsp:Transcript_11607/g.48292  ORF Transcript_11607/g.48292 Transcript_11607/m.48292 type:complete len:225 (+) Transcript_11607:398-1072(+)
MSLDRDTVRKYLRSLPARLIGLGITACVLVVWSPIFLVLMVIVFIVYYTVKITKICKRRGIGTREREGEVSMPERIEDPVYTFSAWQLGELEEITSPVLSERIETTPEFVDDLLRNLSRRKPKKWCDGEDPCCICLDRLVENVESRDIFIAPKCKHAYHLKCISKWVFTRQSIDCPICQQQFISEKQGRAFDKLASRRSLLREDAAEPRTWPLLETNPAAIESV